MTVFMPKSLRAHSLEFQIVEKSGLHQSSQGEFSLGFLISTISPWLRNAVSVRFCTPPASDLQAHKLSAKSDTPRRIAMTDLEGVTFLSAAHQTGAVVMKFKAGRLHSEGFFGFHKVRMSPIVAWG
jgi:hypothetical protein